jgi:hypothetical protein
VRDFSDCAPGGCSSGDQKISAVVSVVCP